jgi:hypothetical protein
MANPPQSSPLSSPVVTSSFETGSSASRPGSHYRPASQLPFELVQHAQTYLEEGLFTQAFNLLLSVTNNSASTVDRSAPVTVPPASHLALAATLAVHPRTTTRTNDRERWNQANAALRLLKSVHSLAGPVNSPLGSAFIFRQVETHFTRPSPGQYHDEDDEQDDRDTSTGFDLKSTYARSQSLFARAEDFWYLIGWTLNCSCLPGIYAKRWQHYRLLIDVFLDVLEADWEIRTQPGNETPEESLLWQYIELSFGGHARQRRILRAIFADGSARSMNEFREVFVQELREPLKEDRGNNKLEKLDHVDIDKDVYGDYLVEDEQDLSDGVGDAVDSMSIRSGRAAKRVRTRVRTPSTRRLTPRSSASSLRSAYTTDGDGDTSQPTESTLGDQSSIHVRLRLLRLLAFVSAHETLTSTSPTTFPDLEDLLILFVEFVRPLPVALFAQFVLPSPSNPFDTTTVSSFCEVILQRTLEHSAKARTDFTLLSQEALEAEYLPYAASKNSIAANARVSVCIESLLRVLAMEGKLKKNESLKAALANGVERRIGKVADLAEKKAGKKVKKLTGDDAVAWNWLMESGERMTKVVDGLK